MIAVIDGCGSNISSILNCLERLRCQFVLTKDPKLIMSSSHVILPGVGAAGVAMENLKQLGLDEVIKSLQQPFLGICLGMQLLYEFSMEDNVQCLGIIPGRISKMISTKQLFVPHIGWSKVEFKISNILFNQIPDESYFYFVHSYQASINEHTIATTNYGQSFASIVQKQNFIGMQFHPERSSQLGLKMLKNFVS